MILLILIAFALLAGGIFLAYTFGDAVVDMLANLIGMPKGIIVSLLLGIVLVVLSLRVVVKLIKRYE